MTRRRFVFVVATVCCLLLAIGGISLARDKVSSGGDPAMSTTVTNPPPASEDVVAVATHVARSNSDTAQFFEDGAASVSSAVPTAIDPSAPTTQGVTLRLQFPRPYSFTGSFPEAVAPARSDKLLTGRSQIDASEVSSLMVVVNLQTQSVVNVIPDPSDLGAKVDFHSAFTPETVGGD